MAHTTYTPPKLAATIAFSLLSLIITAGFIRFAASSLEGFEKEGVYILLGALLLAAIYQYIPIPRRVYILGHELTHALAVLLFGGRIKRFSVKRDGGMIAADTSNAFISLAPYFLPLYTVLIIILFNIAGLFVELRTILALYYILIGASYAFHIITTFLFARSYQPDLRDEGLVFSYSAILFANIIIFTFMLALAVKGFSLLLFYKESMQSAWQAALTFFK